MKSFWHSVDGNLSLQHFSESGKESWSEKKKEPEAIKRHVHKRWQLPEISPWIVSYVETACTLALLKIACWHSFLPFPVTRWPTQIFTLEIASRQRMWGKCLSSLSLSRYAFIVTAVCFLAPNAWHWSGGLLNKLGFLQWAWQRQAQNEMPLTWPALVFCFPA